MPTIGDVKSQRIAVFLVVSVTATGCSGSGDATQPSPEDQGPALSYLALFPEQHAAIVGDHVTLQVTARDLSGADLTDVTPEFTISDSSVVRVEAGGLVVSTGVGTATVRASAGGRAAEATFYVGSPTYDLATLGPPRVLSASYIDLSKIGRVSRFRSTVGHSYVDGSGETCRSMKHYFEPKASEDWTKVDVYAPASGTIWHIAPDGAFGYRVLLAPRDLPALEVQIFHVNLDPDIVVNTWVDAGDHIGTHSSSLTMSDIAVSVGSKEEGTLISYFETMTDGVFAEYQARGVSSREAAVITKEERDADPVPCEGETPFTVQGTLPDWLDLS